MPTTVKEAAAKLEEKTGMKISEMKEVKMYGQYPPIEKLDASLGNFAECEKLMLSTNAIEKITGLHGLRNLKTLSLGRNYIKSFSGLEAVGDTLVNLYISYNFIEKLKGVNVLKKLVVLYMSNNNVKDWNEFQRLAELPNLLELLFVGNPLEEKATNEGIWRDEVQKRLPRLRKLDGSYS
uniref:Dynein axonemal light chain 1 n=1 Tax=Strigamia maritima TaxID=126957 RepID=T1IPX6_STRMM